MMFCRQRFGRPARQVGNRPVHQCCRSDFVLEVNLSNKAAAVLSLTSRTSAPHLLYSTGRLQGRNHCISIRKTCKTGRVMCYLCVASLPPRHENVFPIIIAPCMNPVSITSISQNYTCIKGLDKIKYITAPLRG